MANQRSTTVTITACLYEFSFTPSVEEHSYMYETTTNNYNSSIKKIVLLYKTQGYQKINTCSSEQEHTVLIFVKRVEQPEAASKIQHSECELEISTIPFTYIFDTFMLLQPLFPINFDKLIKNNYAYFPNLEQHRDTVKELVKAIDKRSNDDVQARIQELQEQIATAEKVTLSMERDRTKIFCDELEKNISDLTVIHEYGPRNKYSRCGRSQIDIVILSHEGKNEDTWIYTAGAVMEMKTCTKEPLTPDNEAQIAYEMLKLGTDMAIEDRLMRGEDVNKVIVYGILVDMERVEGLIMELTLNFLLKTASCVKYTKQIALSKAFQFVTYQLYRWDNFMPPRF